MVARKAKETEIWIRFQIYCPVTFINPVKAHWISQAIVWETYSAIDLTVFSVDTHFIVF